MATKVSSLLVSTTARFEWNYEIECQVLKEDGIWISGDKQEVVGWRAIARSRSSKAEAANEG